MTYSAREALTKISLDARKMDIPITAVLELTPRCSLDCKMCYIHLTEEQMKGRRELTGEQWKKIIDDSVEAGVFDLLFTGGECMMHRDFKDIYLHAKKKPVFIMVNTNATLFNDEWVDFFAKNPPQKMKISLYGSSEDGYERVTGKRVYARVKENILRLKQAGISIKIAVTVSRQLYDETIDIIKFARENNFEYLVDMTMIQAYDDTGRSIDDYGLTPDEVAAKYVEMAKEFGYRLFDNEKITELPKRIETTDQALSLRCAAGRAKICILWTGMAVPCFWFDGSVGVDINKEGFAAAWEKCVKVSKEYVLPIECVKCRYATVCQPCAIHRNNPKDPGHFNPEICKVTIAKINAGVVKLPEITEKTEE